MIGPFSSESHSKVVELLSKFCTNINAKSHCKEIFLHMAVEVKKIEVVKALLEHGADINAKNCHQETPLHIAVKMKEIEVVKVLLEHGADINVKDIYQGPEAALTILIFARIFAKEDCTRLTTYRHIMINSYMEEINHALREKAKFRNNEEVPTLQSCAIASICKSLVNANNDHIRLSYFKNDRKGKSLNHELLKYIREKDLCPENSKIAPVLFDRIEPVLCEALEAEAARSILNISEKINFKKSILNDLTKSIFAEVDRIKSELYADLYGLYADLYGIRRADLKSSIYEDSIYEEFNCIKSEFYRTVETEVTSSISCLFEKKNIKEPDYIKPKLYKAWKAEVISSLEKSIHEKFDQIKPELYTVRKKAVSKVRKSFEDHTEDGFCKIVASVAMLLTSLFIGSTVAMMIVASNTEKFAKKVALFTIGGVFILPSLVGIAFIIFGAITSIPDCIRNNKIRSKLDEMEASPVLTVGPQPDSP